MNNTTWKYPSVECSTTQSHWFNEVVTSVFMCKYCLVAMWQPKDYYTALQFTREIGEMGLQDAYKLHTNGKVSGILTLIAQLSRKTRHKTVLTADEVTTVVRAKYCQPEQPRPTYTPFSTSWLSNKAQSLVEGNDE